MDRLELYDPPALPTGPAPTSWDHDDDHRLETITRPGNVLVSFDLEEPGGGAARSG
ncbi:MAG: hypothetical protein IT372_08700 [Polyangiaceae bacterium]|nr:hypothetical protein [Polyangiaceae bacterium]